MKMSPEYMAELHKFLYLSNDSDMERLEPTVATHLKYIPRKKLYRYRKCNDRELQILEENSIWLSDPEKFPDMFDATIPMAERRYIDFEYPFFFSLEAAYKALVDTSEEGEIIPNKSDLLEAIYKTMAKYSQEEIDAELLKIFGEEEYRKILSHKLDFSRQIERTRKFLCTLSNSPRNSLTIASFTTRYDNRNMWENYAENYTGFCIEYCFSDSLLSLSSKSAWDILHLLAVKYFKKRPLFDYTDILQRIVQSDMKLTEFNIDVDEFLTQYYQSVTAKLYDYRAEQEWRLVMKRERLGKYSFPYASKIFLGKDMSDERIEQMSLIADKLNIPVFMQTINREGNTFEYQKNLI
ncbi:DUF2971 domain-containing protein [Sinanaerobacter sp. ZZT-01]|uniref:DUF2971 domain-containing protein n=1 Tax=Sinanaerobacter sp. ZZT-01 TaxID=3111540 RepID=UPI002D79E86A|nr:DUF2971 domain-containing protein [Sinanaerobacter sp. ZZT-01]WRR93357.1 DUF2971 domain-containing protein [Sinanaerobacter sp. ZZT-01]